MLQEPHVHEIWRRDFSRPTHRHHMHARFLGSAQPQEIKIKYPGSRPLYSSGIGHFTADARACASRKRYGTFGKAKKDLAPCSLGEIYRNVNLWVLETG